MAEKIKQLSKFSEDALKIAVKSLPKEEREHFERGLALLENKLGVKKKNVPSMSTKLNDEAIFRNSIIPQIERKVTEIEKTELSKKSCVIKVRFEFRTNFNGLTGEQQRKAHENVVALETGLKNLTLLAQFSRGMLYITLARESKLNGHNWKRFVSDELKISTMTALRYMTLSSIIVNYPRLILCELSFTQILKHKTRLLKFLKSEEGQDLGSALALSIDIQAQGKSVTINNELVNIPTTNFPTDPDYKYRDDVNREDVSETASMFAAAASSENEEDALLAAMEGCDIKIE